MDDELLTRMQMELSRVGGRLRALRKERGWRLEDLSERVGISRSYLSRIESGEREPSIAALFAVAAAYDVPFHALFEPEAEAEERVVTRGDAMHIQRGNGLLYAPLSSADRTLSMRPLRVVVSAEREGEELYRHEGEEWLYVLSGRLGLRLGEKDYDLGTGDAAHFDASEGHRLFALGGEDAEVILVAAAVAHPLLRSYM